MEKPENCIIVIFGASGDLTSRKLIPALFELKLQQLLPEKFFIIGVSHTEFTHEAFCDKIIIGIRSFSGEKEINLRRRGISPAFFFVVSYQWLTE